MNRVDLSTLIQAIETLYINVGVDGNSLAAAERFLSGIVNDNTITIDLSSGLAKGSDVVSFGICNIIYQQVCIFRRNPNMEAISSYSCAFENYFSEILKEKRKIPSSMTFNRICLCYAVLQTLDDTHLESLIHTCYQNMASSSALRLEVYITIYKCLLEEVDSNHLPESVKDGVVNILLAQKSHWLSLFFSLFQSHLSPSLLTSLLICLSYSTFACSLTNLLSFPASAPPNQSFLALLLALCKSQPHSQPAYQCELLLTRLIELRGYPSPRSLPTAVHMIYTALSPLCAAAESSDTSSLIALIHLISAVMQEAPVLLPQLNLFEPTLIQFLMQITANPSLDIASLAMDMWLRLTEMDEFYQVSIMDQPCYNALLFVIRDQVMDREVRPDIFTNALPPIQFVERISNWKPRVFDDFRNEVYPSILEMETSPFRHGPPGSEDVLRSMFDMVGSKLLEALSVSLSVETDAMKVEADCYVLGQFVESIMADLNQDRKMEPWLSYFPSLLSTLFSHVMRFQNDLLSRQFAFVLFRLLLLKVMLPDTITDICMQSTLFLLQREVTSSYGADLFMALTSFYPEVVCKANVNESAIASFMNTSLYTVVRMKLAKCIVLMHRDDSVNQQVQLFVQLWKAICVETAGAEAMLCAAVLLNSIWQLFDKLNFNTQTMPIFQEAITSFMGVITSFTADCHHNPSTNEESQAMLSFCTFLQHSCRGWLAELFSHHIQTIMDILLAYYQQYPSSGILLKTMAFLSNMFASSHTQAFYAAFRTIVTITSSCVDYNDEEYVCELFTLFSAFPLQFPVQFNQDAECVMTLLRTSDSYIRSAPKRGKIAVFSLLTRILKLEHDNEQVLQIVSQITGDLLNLVITECVSWDRSTLRSGSTFLYYLIVKVVPVQERSKTIVAAIASTYPGVFTGDELVQMDNILQQYLSRRVEQFLMVFLDIVGIINNTNTKDALIAYGL